MYLWKPLQKVYDSQESLEYKLEKERISMFSEVVEFNEYSATINPIRLKNTLDDSFLQAIEKLPQEQRNAFIDVVFHYIANVELLSGLSRENVKYILLSNKIKRGEFGEVVKEGYMLYSYTQKQHFIKQVLKVIENGATAKKFEEMFYYIFPRGAVLFYDVAYKEYVIHFAEKTNYTQKNSMVACLVSFFLPLNFKHSVVYENYPYVIGVKEIAKIGEIMIK